MKRLILFISLICMITHVFAFNPETLVNEGNDAYKKGLFDQAVKKYLRVVDTGYVSAELYFNLGNAYFKTNSIKEAILYYERAKLLNPGDKDIEYNLEMARSFTIDKIEAMPELFFISWIKWVRNLMSAEGWTKLNIITFILTLFLLLLYLLSGNLGLKKIGFWVGVVVIIISAVSFTMAYRLKENQTAKNTAIIFTPSVTLKSSPADSGTNLFILHEGSKVEILDQVSDWRWVRIADGSRGWIRMADMVTI
jgi:tetratricopeptide (TPR) repeat protein